MPINRHLAKFAKSQIDLRRRLLGRLEGHVVVVAHTPRLKNTRIISMRKGNHREEKVYQERLETP